MGIIKSVIWPILPPRHSTPDQCTVIHSHQEIIDSHHGPRAVLRLEELCMALSKEATLLYPSRMPQDAHLAIFGVQARVMQEPRLVGLPDPGIPNGHIF